MKGKILDSVYNPGYDSWVLKQTKYGRFSGYTKLHPADEDIDNSYDGCRIAEFRADLQAYKEKAKRMRERAKGARIVWHAIIDYIDNDEADIITKEVEMLEKQADAAREYYENMKAYEPMFINSLLKKRRETREMIDKRNAGN